MNKRNLFVRITAIVLCALMVLSVVTVALYAFAAEPTASYVAAPDTGSESMVWVIISAVAAVAVIVGCLVVPKAKKK